MSICKHIKKFHIITLIAALLPVALIFNNNVWFDEAYTLSLIQHNYGEVIDILKSDMHPPLYFLSLKLFCDVFGYSIIVTKLFSVIGYSALIVTGAIILRRHYNESSALIFEIAVGAVPMMFYFSCQQRSYSWSVFFVTICFLQALLSIKNHNIKHFILMSLTASAAGYNHFFALLAVAIIFFIVHLYVIFKDHKLIKKLIISDLILAVSYSAWIIPLISQARSAAKEFWLKGVEPLSVNVFILTLAVIALFLLKKSNRRFENLFAAACVLGLQIAGLLGTILVRPFYIGRYSIVITGIGAVFIALGTENLSGKLKTAVVIILSAVLVINFSTIAAFEYNSSASDFRKRFESTLSGNDSFLYFDSSFGVMSYYYPNNTHYCTFSQDWFSAFKNVKYIDKREIRTLYKPDKTIWMVTENNKKIPPYITKYFKTAKTDSFKCDFNTYIIYRATLK